MKAVILVGGEGTRLRPLTCNTPKPMVPIVNKPFLERMVGYLRDQGIADIVLSLCYLPDRIQSYFEDGERFGVNLDYCVEKVPLGTAGAVKQAADQFGFDETLFVLNGDVLTDLDLQAMLLYHREREAAVTISLTPVADPTPYGVVERDEQGRVRRFIEKPGWDAVTTNLVNAGVYIVEPKVLKYAPPRVHFMFENGLFPVLLQVGEPVYGFASNAYWIDIGTPARYLTVHHDLLVGQLAHDFPGQRLYDGVWVGQGCEIDPSAKLLGPVILGKDCRIDRNVRLTGPIVMGDRCRVGPESVIEDAVIWADTEIRRGVVMKTCVVAEGSVIDDNTSITQGTIVGDHVTIGSGNRFEHGIKIWPHRVIEANTITF